jgi:peptide chain release factor subunit 1
LQKI